MFRISFEVEDMNDFERQVTSILGESPAALKEHTGLTRTVTKTEVEAINEEHIDEAKEIINKNSSVPALVPTVIVNAPKAPIAAQAPAVTPEVPGPAPIISNPDVDADGLPWDGRIHSSVKSRTTKDVWKKKRSVDATLVASVEAELRGVSANIAATVTPPYVTPVVAPILPAPPVAVAAAPPVLQPVAAAPPVLQPVAAAPPMASAIVPTPAPTPAAQPDMKPAHSVTTFKANIVQVVALLISQKKITQEYVASLSAHFGVKELYEIFNNDAQVTELFDNFCQYGFITKVG